MKSTNKTNSAVLGGNQEYSGQSTTHVGTENPSEFRFLIQELETATDYTGAQTSEIIGLVGNFKPVEFGEEKSSDVASKPVLDPNCAIERLWQEIFKLKRINSDLSVIKEHLIKLIG